MTMTFDEYQEAAGRTARRPTSDAEFEKAALIRTLGLGGEAGEVAELIKKHIGHGHELDLSTLRKELGDVLWYVTMLADLFYLDLSDIAEANIEKLKKRYPDGFTSEASVNRVTE